MCGIFGVINATPAINQSWLDLPAWSTGAMTPPDRDLGKRQN